MASVAGANGESRRVLPQQDEAFSRSLSGEWLFQYHAGPEEREEAEFIGPAYEASDWSPITVPGNWELQGFADPRYDLKEQEEGTGWYRRSFRIPEEWLGGRQVYLRFEGVAFGFEAWMNGRKIGGSSASAFNPHTFDVTEVVEPGRENVVAVKVLTKPFAFEFDVNDDWALSGIHRDVTVFSVPATHVVDLHTATRLNGDRSADLSVGVTVSRPGAKVVGRLIPPGDAEGLSFELSPDEGNVHRKVVRVASPELWTAESPALYRLELALIGGGKTLQRIEQRVGLREVAIRDRVLLLNGRPIKLRGANRHDLEPETGRAVTEEGMRRDLEVMREANMNFVRTSHYPPHPRFLELCDELGFYVMDEVAIGKGEEHQNDPAYLDTMLARTESTIARDRNHASVIIWSIGNENPVTELLLKAGRRAKELDPTRPICYPMSPYQFDDEYMKLPDFVDIYAPHYPTNARLREYAEILDRPVILTEYAHALGLATGRIQDQWDLIQETPHFAGGAIWHLMDQGILRTASRKVNRARPTRIVWLDGHRNYDNRDSFGQDGIVYADRSPSADFWETRKVYSPVQIAERVLPVKPGAGEIALTIENRYDFRSLEGMNLKWSLLRNGNSMGDGELPLSAAARSTETVGIPVDIPADASMDVLSLGLRCVDGSGNIIIERTVQLDLEGSKRSQWVSELPTTGGPKVSESSEEIRIAHGQWELSINPADARLKIVDKEGRLLVSGLYPHAGRRLTLSEHYNARNNGMWRVTTLTEAEDVDVSVEQTDSGARLSVAARYPRSDKKGQAMVGGYTATVGDHGSLEIEYGFEFEKPSGVISEAGMSLVAPKNLAEFRWIGMGPWAGYPGKDRLNEFGVFHLNRGDLRFQGNRRGTELAMLTTPDGSGIALATEPGDVAVEITGDKTLFKHNAVISGLGNKIGHAEYLADPAELGKVSGRFTLVPLSADWPAPLVEWFGSPSAAEEVYRPFHHSYDQ